MIMLTTEPRTCIHKETMSTFGTGMNEGGFILIIDVSSYTNLERVV